ncbi:hypothetical protein DSM3645_03223 [Blastopirellula marina DSM 3645]|uniref:Uncharacterized protein n=1 Tax=Blastopirellula marina DSM 3645 TaxID=314230 RepID=A3ZVV8_9BACT|nr:hypothetical protein DSM3645_03223 [Blastopirellula marina DSM 3645]
MFCFDGKGFTDGSLEASFSGGGLASLNFSPKIQSVAFCAALAAPTTKRLSPLRTLIQPCRYDADCSMAGGLIPLTAQRNAAPISATSSSRL